MLVRVEIGPREAQNGTAVVALANEPGEVAQKETVNVELQLLKEVKARMEQVRGGGEDLWGMWHVACVHVQKHSVSEGHSTVSRE